MSNADFPQLSTPILRSDYEGLDHYEVLSGGMAIPIEDRVDQVAMRPLAGGSKAVA